MQSLHETFGDERFIMKPCKVHTKSRISSERIQNSLFAKNVLNFLAQLDGMQQRIRTTNGLLWKRAGHCPTNRESAFGVFQGVSLTERNPKQTEKLGTSSSGL